MFSWKQNKQFSFYILDESRLKIHVLMYGQYQETYFAQFAILNELLDNGFADQTSDSYEVETKQILKLNEIDKQILCLPHNYPYEIYIQSHSQLNQSDFKFDFGFYDFTPNGNRLFAKRTGAIIVIEGREYLLSENQFLICEALDKFNALSESERTFQNNLKCFSDIKALSINAASLLDSYLESQNVYCPDKIKIDLEFTDGVFEIIPTIELENQIGFLKTFDQFPRTKDVYPVSDSKGTTRVVINENQKKELDKVKGNRRTTDEKVIAEIVEHPEKYFDENTIDFSVFYSERVKEIGVYKPKYYPFVCPYKSEWIPGIAVKDRVDGEKRIHFKSKHELDEFENEKKATERIGRKIVSWKNTDIPIDVAEKFINIAKKQFENIKEPAYKGESVNSDKVLIIKENADLLEYTETVTQISEVNHGFSEIDNLNSIIELKHHQIEGIAWLQSLYKNNLCGCLLADDMGLGKTLQLLYFLEWHAQLNKYSKPYLIVAPVTLLENWESEYEKFFKPKNLTLRKLYGKIDIVKGFDNEVNKRDARTLQYKHIILTNYESLREYQAALCLVDFAVVVLDEAQKIKTPGTLVTNVTKALKADFKIAMTGTPVENTLIDLWCILDFSVPGLLGNAKDFAKEFQNPLKNEETNAKELGEKLRNKIGFFIKRRLKKDVAKDLPIKFDNENSRVKKQMPPAQLERYKVEMELAKNTDLTGVDRRNQILKSLWAIRDISDHPLLVDSQIANIEPKELISASAKIQVMLDILEEVKAKGEKAIVFADRKETQKLLQKVIHFSYKIYPSIVNGDTPATKQNEGKAKLSRQQTINRFQEELGFNVIVMSQLAAGVGLNVTKANHVIHYTRHWNPAKEAQATDRAYRIGQQMDVHVYYPMAVFPSDMINEDGSRQKSFDEILDKLLSIKTELANNTMFPTEQAEVRPDEIFGSVFGFQTESKPCPLTIKKVDKLNPNLFEASIAAIYSAMGFSVSLTPNSNDKGADVVAIREGESYLIQAKQTISTVDNKAVQEIVGAKKYYEHIFKETFKLVVITNGEFTPSAHTIARSNQVILTRRSDFEKMISENNISIQEVTKHEAQRMQRI
jgi:SNF2 family DNA or RNA helicase/HJR/Mrr/RecB family endonuclease